jgi:rod shape determining protein RodA
LDRRVPSATLKPPPLSSYLALFKPVTRGRWDLLTPLTMLGLGAVGMAFIYSAQYSIHGTDWLKQGVFLALGAGGYAAVALVDYRFWLGVAHWCYLACLGLLVLVLIPWVGTERFGARRWLDFGAFSLQPSQLAMVAVLLITASLLVSSKMATTGEAWRTLSKLALAAGGPMLLILLQPDLKSVIVLPPMVFAMLYVSQFPARLCAGALAVFTLAAGLVYLDASRYHSYLVELHAQGLSPTDHPGVAEPVGLLPLHNYQRERIVAFLFPDDFDPRGGGWNRIQSQIAVGSGGLTGKGWTEGTQAQLGYLPRPVAHNDFIFSVIAEEKGFLGSFTVLCLFGLMLFNGVRIAGLARDRFGTLLALGVTVILAVHVFVNIAMTIGLVPITGIPLPFISYGGSFVLSCGLLQGLVQSVYRFRKDSP